MGLFLNFKPQERQSPVDEVTVIPGLENALKRLILSQFNLLKINGI